VLDLHSSPRYKQVYQTLNFMVLPFSNRVLLNGNLNAWPLPFLALGVSHMIRERLNPRVLVLLVLQILGKSESPLTKLSFPISFR
jgi:hypothetical protein